MIYATKVPHIYIISKTGMEEVWEKWKEKKLNFLACTEGTLAESEGPYDVTG